MSTVSKRAPRRGREMSAQGIALGSGLQPYTRPVRAKEWSSDINLLPLQGEIHICPHTQVDSKMELLRVPFGRLALG